VLVAPLVFAKLYFPHSDPLVGTLEAFGIYAVGFVSRPIGAALFGHYGDRIGRKVTLIATLLLTGLSTFAVGFVPGYDTIGIGGAVILTAVRFIQGMGIGGEWGGATLIAMEWAKTNTYRGFITGWTQWDGPAGLFLANIVVLIFSAISGDQFLDWGGGFRSGSRSSWSASGSTFASASWRPRFQRLLDQQEVARTPVVEVIRRHPKEIILTALCRNAEQGPFYIFAAFVFTLRDDGVAQLTRFPADRTVDRDWPFGDHDPAFRLHFRPHRPQADVPDRRDDDGGIRLIYFALLNTMIPGVVFFAIVVSFIPHDMMYGPQAALIAECFSPRLATAARPSAFTCRR
jgi:MFS family permease